MLYNVVLVSALIWISHRNTYVLSLLNLPSHLPFHPTPQGCHRHHVELPASYSKFPLAICFTYDDVYVSMLLSQFIPPCPSSTVSTSLFSMYAFLLLPYKQVHQYHFFQTPYTCINTRYLFFSFWLTSLCIRGSRLIHLTRNLFF